MALTSAAGGGMAVKPALRAGLRRLAFLALGVLALGIALREMLRALPYPELDAWRDRDYGLVLLDRNGADTLRVFPAGDGVKREWVPLEDIPPGVTRVFIQAEDRRFFLHPGVDPLAAAMSAIRNLRAGRVVSGASTITMQLARLVHPRRGGLRAKCAEAWDALRLEATLSKREILELWLNNIPFGSNIEGIAAMSRARFGIPPAQIDDSRALLLAVIPRRPGRYDPGLHPEAAAEAAWELSRRCGLPVTRAELENAAREAGEDSPRKAPFLAPQFTERVREMWGVGSGEWGVDSRFPTPDSRLPIPDSRFPTPDTVRTTLDLGMQNLAEELLKEELSGLAEHRVSNGAVLAIENDTGAVRVYAGSASWFDDDAGGKNDGVRARNQPGSCLKPFLYALALDRGFGPQDILPDLPTVFGGPEAYGPVNFNNRFNGPVRFRVALASSLNVPAVYLAERLGVRAFEEYLAGLGFESVASRMGSHGTGLALGNAEVSLEELVRAFSAFPRGGAPASLCFIEGDGGAPSAVEEKPLMSPYAAWTIADILSDKASRFVGFGPAPVLSTPFEAMFKTGTANQFQHIWALGASGRFTVGVWMGNFSGATVIGRTGSSIPARIASRLLAALEAAPAPTGTAAPPKSAPLAGVREVEICALSGMARTPWCPGALREYLRESGVPGPCDWHRPGGETLYPPEYRAWLTERFRRGEARQSGAGRIRLPVPGAVFYLDPSAPTESQALRLETSGFGEAGRVYLDGALLGGLNPAGVFAIPLPAKGRHEVQVEDDKGASAGTVFTVR